MRELGRFVGRHGGDAAMACAMTPAMVHTG
jgi:hypothetical protein